MYEVDYDDKYSVTLSDYAIYTQEMSFEVGKLSHSIKSLLRKV